MMANEYSNKTIKQNLIDGLSKKEFIMSKFLTVISFALVSTVFVFVVSMILGLIYSDFNELSIIFSGLEFLPAFFLKLVGFFSFCLFLGILVKRSAFALGFLILWAILEQLVFGLLGWQLVSWDTARTIKGLFPLESMARLLEEPFSRLKAVQSVANEIGEKFTFDYHVHWYEILIVSGWTVVFIYLSYALLKKRDL
jgi:ABC-type transport system involved in multi-copper enzyme maturation permease subunit